MGQLCGVWLTVRVRLNVRPSLIGLLYWSYIVCWPGVVVVVLAAVVVVFVLCVTSVCVCVCCVLCVCACDGVAVWCAAEQALVLLASVRPLFPRCVLCIVIAA